MKTTIGKVAAVVSALGMLAIATPAFAHYGSPDATVSVTNSNSATVVTNTNASSNTGSNGATGGNGTSGTSDGWANVTTGDAGSLAQSATEVNSNTTSVQEPSVGGSHGGSTSVGVDNNNYYANVTADTAASAATGSNGATGGTTSSNNNNKWKGSSSTNSATATVHTGNAQTESDSVTVVNTNVTHIKH